MRIGGYDDVVFFGGNVDLAGLDREGLNGGLAADVRGGVKQLKHVLPRLDTADGLALVVPGGKVGGEGVHKRRNIFVLSRFVLRVAGGLNGGAQSKGRRYSRGDGGKR